MAVIQMDLRWKLVIVLACISLISDFDNLSVCILPIWLPALEKYLLEFFDYFFFVFFSLIIFNQYLIYFWILRDLYIFLISPSFKVKVLVSLKDCPSFIFTHKFYTSATLPYDFSCHDLFLYLCLISWTFLVSVHPRLFLLTLREVSKL